MKLLARVEKCRECWFLLSLSVFFFVLRIPSFIEPYWYGDEGIYEVIGLALRNGRLLYTGIWDNKPPLLYLLYAVFSGDQFFIRLTSSFFGIACIVIFFFLSRKVFVNNRLPYILTSLYAILFGLPLVEGNIANAENFMQLFILLACFCTVTLYEKKEEILQKKNGVLFFSGVLLGIAFLFKIVALFDFAALFVFLLIISAPSKIQTKKQVLHWIQESLPSLIFITIGFMIPFGITALAFLIKGGFIEFLKASFIQNIGYVGYKNAFIIPQGLLILKLLLLGGVIVYLFYKRMHFSPFILFVLVWTAFSLFNAFFSQRPYTHYVLVALPSVLLFCGFLALQYKKHMVLVVATFVLLYILAKQFSYYSVKKTILYYPNFFSFVAQKKSVTQYQSFFDRDTPRDYEIAGFLRNRLPDNATVFVWGNSAQIYVLSHTLPPGRYTVAYHVGSKEAIKETQAAIMKNHPAYIVILPDSSSLPFSLYGYAYSLSIKGTDIYEKSY